MKKKWEIDRRKFLRNSGAAIALPVLNAMAPSMARAQNKDSQRLVLLWHPNGVPPPRKSNGEPYKRWEELGQAGVHPDLLKELSPVADYTSYVAGLKNDFKNSSIKRLVELGRAQSAHASAMVTAHCGKIVTEEKEMGRTFDQFIAESSLHKGSTFNSLAAIMTAYTKSSHDVPPTLLNTISWRGPSNPVKHYLDPRDLFDKAFKGGVGTPSQEGLDEKTRRELLSTRSVLDNVVNEIKSLNNKLGREDKVTLEKYFDEINDIDRQTAALLNNEGGTSPISSCTSPSKPASYTRKSLSADEFEVRRKAHQAILLKVFQCDMTRVFSMMLGCSGGFYQKFLLPGMKKGQVWKNKKPDAGNTYGSGSWHPMHHWDDTRPNENYYVDHKIAYHNFLEVNKFLYRGVAELAVKMKNTPTINGKNLLDETLIVFGSTLSAEGRGEAHNARNQHRILIGKGGGAFKTKQKVTYKARYENRSLFDLWLTIMNGFNLKQSKFGDSKGEIRELLA